MIKCRFQALTLLYHRKDGIFGKNGNCQHEIMVLLMFLIELYV